MHTADEFAEQCLLGLHARVDEQELKLADCDVSKRGSRRRAADDFVEQTVDDLRRPATVIGKRFEIIAEKSTTDSAAGDTASQGRRWR